MTLFERILCMAGIATPREVEICREIDTLRQEVNTLRQEITDMKGRSHPPPNVPIQLVKMGQVAQMDKVLKFKERGVKGGQ